jgi:preprotein translocase subunit Sss1
MKPYTQESIITWMTVLIVTLLGLACVGMIGVVIKATWVYIFAISLLSLF